MNLSLPMLFEQSLNVLGRTVLLGLQFLLSAGALLPGLTLLAAVWFWLSASLRRQHRARCFIDLLEIGLKQGRTVEDTVRSLSAQRVSELGVGLHLVAAWMERGLRLGAALDEAPGFLPPHIRAMLKSGEAMGDLPRVLPICRAALQDAISLTHKGVNNFVVVLFVSPIAPLMIWFLHIWIEPKLRDIAIDMAGEPAVTAPLNLDGLWDWSLALASLSLVIWTLFWLPASLAWCVQRFLPEWSGMLDRITHRLPWARARMQRDFSRMLALLLDSGMPEPAAVTWAARSTGNRAFTERAARVLRDLENGVKLTEAVRWLDDAGEFQWRLQNAASAQAGSRFASALAGWHEALDAKAFQQEQVFSQATSTGLVLLNGATVALVAFSLFHILTGITEMALW